MNTGLVSVLVINLLRQFVIFSQLVFFSLFSFSLFREGGGKMTKSAHSIGKRARFYLPCSPARTDLTLLIPPHALSKPF